MLQQSAEVTANTLKLLFNNPISNSYFPENSELADVNAETNKRTY